MISGTTVQVEFWLGQLASDPASRDRLLAVACGRLQQLASRMFRRGHALRRWEETGDILQESLLRLNHALADVQPQTAAQFFGLASLQIRRVLIDMSRKHFGPRGVGKNHGSVAGSENDGQPDGVVPTREDDLDDWTRFHEAVQGLGEESRTVVDMLFYQGLSQEDAGVALGVTERTVKRWWRTARQELNDVLGGTWPAD